MADQSDVENVLVNLAAAALYPNGDYETSTVGSDCRIYRGWPQSAALDSDLAAGLVNVTVFAKGEPGRNTTRYAQQWRGTAITPALIAVASGNSVTFSGAATLGQVAGILADEHAYAYRIQSSDTPAAVAANLATLARADWIVQQSGTALSLIGAANVNVRIVADCPVVQEARRQEQSFRITCWCPTPAIRDSAAIAIDQVLAAVRFIDLPDGTQGRILYEGTLEFDQSQDALLYRRDLLYMVEYATTLSASQPRMLFGDLVLNAAQLFV
jgi:hypothetical protein